MNKTPYNEQDVLPTTYVSVTTLADRFDTSKTSIWRWTRESNFPQPVKLTGGTTRWKMSEVEAWEVSQGGATQ